MLQRARREITAQYAWACYATIGESLCSLSRSQGWRWFYGPVDWMMPGHTERSAAWWREVNGPDGSSAT